MWRVWKRERNGASERCKKNCIVNISHRIIIIWDELFSNWTVMVLMGYHTHRWKKKFSPAHESKRTKQKIQMNHDNVYISSRILHKVKLLENMKIIHNVKEKISHSAWTHIHPVNKLFYTWCRRHPWYIDIVVVAVCKMPAINMPTTCVLLFVVENFLSFFFRVFSRSFFGSIFSFRRAFPS